MDSNINKYTMPITSDEHKALLQFKEFLSSKGINYDQSKFDDSYLVRFLRARSMDLKKTFEMFTNFLKWRDENKIDLSEPYDYPEIDKIRMFYPHGWHKTDKSGRPINIEILGELKVDELFKLTTPERLIKYQSRELEKLFTSLFPACSKKFDRPVHQIFSILDLKNLSSKLLSKKVYGFLKLSFENSQKYYPEILGQLFIINAGLLFKAGWAVCKGFLDKKTRKKISTVGSDYKKKLLEHIDPENLPKFFGGSCNCEPYGCLYSYAGPWNEQNIPAFVPPVGFDAHVIESKVDVKVQDEKLEDLAAELGDDLKIDGDNSDNEN